MEVEASFDSTVPYESASTYPHSIQAEGVASSQDYADCRRIMLQASKNYSSAGRFLPGDKKPHVEALYALMRVGDDRVDVTHQGFSSPLHAIDDWENAYWHAFETGDSPHPVLRAYLDTSMKFDIPANTMAQYFRAMREDLTITRFPSFEDLIHYMDGSAVPVGRAMTRILGVRPGYTLEQALPGADSLSLAMQLSNFWRDIGEDLRRGRIYIPLEDLDYFRCSEAELNAGLVTSQYIELMEFQFERTESYYRAARRGVRMLATGQHAVMSALEIYRAILPAIRSNHYDVFTRRATISTLRKLSLAAKAYWMVQTA